MKIFTPLLAVFCLISISSWSQTQVTVAGLRSMASPSLTTSYFITDPGRQGLFYYDSKDNVSLDNGGTVIVSAGKRFKRNYSGDIDIRWFGAVSDYIISAKTGSDNTAAFNAAVGAATARQTVMIPGGEWYFKSTLVLPVVTVKKVNFLIYGNIYFAKGAGFVIEGRDQDFRSYGNIDGGNSGATTEATFAAYQGIGIYLKNTYNCFVEVNEIKNFKYGIQQAGEKWGGAPNGCQYNKIIFRSIHHNHTQIRLTVIGASSLEGNWNNETNFYGGQLGLGIPAVTYGQGGWYGIVMDREPSATDAVYTLDGHKFYSVDFEGLEKCVVLKNTGSVTFFGGHVEPEGSRIAFDLDPVTCSGTKIIGMTALLESQFATGRIGNNTTITATPFWIGPRNTKNFAGTEAISGTGGRFIVTTAKYSASNFEVYKQNDLVSLTGKIPSLQAGVTRMNGIIRTIPFKSTFLHVKAATAGSPIVLPRNIGLVRVEATEAKVLKIDSGDLVAFGEGFIVEYLSPKFPLSFVRADNNVVLISPAGFPSMGTYRCTWADGQFKIDKISAEYKSFTQTGSNYVIADGVETHYVTYQWGSSTATLPPAASWPGRTITVKNLQAGQTVIVSGVNASDENTLQGRGAMTVRSEGGVWNVISFYKRGLTY